MVARLAFVLGVAYYVGVAAQITKMCHFVCGPNNELYKSIERSRKSHDHAQTLNAQAYTSLPRE